MTSQSKKFSAVLISLTLALSSAPNALASNVANGKCPSAGRATTIGGTKYICTKSGKKLIWKKSVTKPVAPTTNQSSEDLKLEAIFNTIAAKMDQATPKFDISVNVDPILSNSKWSSDSIASIGTATKVLSALGIDKGQPMKIYLSWGAEYKNQFLPDYCKVGSSGGGSCGQTGILFADLKWFADNWGYGGVEGPYRSEMDKFSFTANLPHEIAHYGQTEAALAVGNTAYWMYTPPWLREGGAEYFKLLSSAYDNKRTYKSLHDLYVLNGIGSCSKFPLSKISPKDSNSDGCEYGKGLLAVEYLVLKVGKPEALFMMQKTSGADTASIFEKTFGFSLSEFEKEADEYFLRVTAGKK